MHFKVSVEFAFILHIHAKLLNCIVCLQSYFTGVKRLLWFIRKNYIYLILISIDKGFSRKKFINFFLLLKYISEPFKSI